MMSDSRLPWQRLQIEAMTAASEFISEDMFFLIIGGAALVQYGSTRDVDIAITPQTLNAFWEKAKSDSRFDIQADEHWARGGRRGVEGLSAEFEFLAIGEQYVPKLCGLVTKFDPVWTASLADIAVTKAYAYQDRGEDCDYEDLLFAPGEMKKAGQKLAQYGIKQSDIATIRSAVKGCEEEGRLSEVME